MSLPIVMTNDFYLEVARGNVTDFAAREIVGTVPAVAGTYDVWNAGIDANKVITKVATAAILYVSSSSSADITQSVIITGLDANYDVITETIALNTTDGQTRVAGTKAFLRVNSVALSAACAGNVYVYYVSAVTAGVPDTKSKIQAMVAIAALLAYNAIYTVPRNKNLYLTSLRYQSATSTTTHDVIITVNRQLYGGANVAVKQIKYVDLGTTNYVDGQVDFMDQPILFPAKSEFRIGAALAGGTAMIMAVMCNLIEESISVVPTTTAVVNKAAYLAYLAAGGPLTLASQNYWLIGLDEEPTTPPSSVNLDDVLCTITGATNYRVAADTNVAFDPAYFVSGKLVTTTKKAIVTIMRCVDSGGGVVYVLAPVNTVVNLGSGVKKVTNISYLA